MHALRLPLAPGRFLRSPGSRLREGYRRKNRELRLLYVGRMTRLKGRPIMLDGLALVAASLARLRNGA
jgi:hypothetical protein